MAVLTLSQVQFSVGPQKLLDHVDLEINPGERVCLIGRNGEGKSTLLRIITGEQRVDDGDVRLNEGYRMASVQQEPKLDGDGTVYEAIAAGLGDVGSLIAEYHDTLKLLETNADEDTLNRLANVQQKLEAADGWSLEQRIERIITRLNLPAEQKVSSLSGGWKRRVAVGQALVQEPDLLLLDEPTNHLDIEAICWLEEFLLSYKGALLFITHDRSFLQRLATRIIELDRGQLTSWPGDYANYLRRKEEREHAESIHNAEFDKKLAQEEVWIRQGIKARRTRNEGRVRALEALRQTRQQRVSKQGTAAIQIDVGEKSGKIVVEAEHVSKAYSGRQLINDFSVTIMRGDKIGLIGPNGVGKSTLLKILLGQEEADSGSVRVGTQLEIAYFDQYREQLIDDATAIENVAEGSDTVTINGKPRHIISYLGDFLFTPERARSSVKKLSGGERNRLLLAKMFSKPANMLILDEPTNDLDIETLEILEELLLNYNGTLILVSHDRAFMNNVVAGTIAFEGDAVVREYVGGYDDWLAQRPRANDKPAEKSVKAAKNDKQTKPAASTPPQEPAKKKLSYKDQRELEQLPKTIEALETEQSDIEKALSDANIYVSSPDKASKLTLRLEAIAAELETAFARWAELDA